MIDLERLRAPGLPAAWRAARPFPHVVIDGLVPPAALEALRAAVGREPHVAEADQIHEFVASSLPPAEPALRAFFEALNQPPVLEAVGAIAGRPLGRAETRSYVYFPGHYLLPHSDHRRELGRAVAYAFYLNDGVEGGELELFDCKLEDGEVIATTPAGIITPRANRIALFAVGEASLHQVREVTAGARASLAGWFYP